MKSVRRMFCESRAADLMQNLIAVCMKANPMKASSRIL